MKKIFCELCDGTEFTKDNGMFVCGGCGTRYTTEEAKAMMREVEGDAVTASGSAVASAVNPNQQQIDNLLLLASNAYEADNNSETESYCNRVIELDATCYKAWFLKGRAVGWSSSIANNRFEEASHSFCKAIDFAPEEEKEELKDQAVDELRRLGLALISTRKNRFAQYPVTEELNGFRSDRKKVLDALLVLLQKGNAVGIPDGYLEEIASLMNQAAVAGFNTARERFTSETWPDTRDLSRYLDEADNCEQLLRQAIDASDDDDEADIQRYENLIIVLEDPIGRWSYKQEWNSFLSEFSHVRYSSLSSSAVAARKSQVAECKNEIKKIKDKLKAKEDEEKAKAEAEKAARIKAYWDAHQDEKKQLEAELSDLKTKIEDYSKEISSLNDQIAPIKKQAEGKVPSEEETEKLSKEIDGLKQRKSGLGLFAGKEKKQIDEQVAALEGRVSALKSKIAEEKKARTEETDKKIKPLQDQIDELNKKKSAAEKRVKAIETELTKDPEE